jgi:hypothetical protein
MKINDPILMFNSDGDHELSEHFIKDLAMFEHV